MRGDQCCKPRQLDGGIFPRLSAPGVHIRTTQPMAKGSYSVVSGTSFAAPHVAGIMALFSLVITSLFG